MPEHQVRDIPIETATDSSPLALLLDDPLSVIRYYYYDVWQETSDPQTQGLPLVDGGPWKLLAIIALYIYFVKFAGPKYMKRREPLNLRWLIFTYNIVMTVGNGLFFYWCSKYTHLGIKSWGCRARYEGHVDPEWEWKLSVVWLYYMSKFIDLFDTIFFVLRKKNDHVSFLHVYHHAMVPLVVWMGLKYVVSESAAFFPLLNSFVHTLMYLYYALSTLGPTVRKYLWWKKYLTRLQIGQLILFLIHCVHLVTFPNCNIPKICVVISLLQVVLLVYLFTAFYRRSYASPVATTKTKTS